MVNWKLLAGIGIAAAGAAGILYYRNQIVGGAAGAAYTAGQAVGAIPSGLAGGVNDGLNPIRQILGQPTVNPPTYQYRTPQFLAPTPSPTLSQAPPPLPTPALQVVAPAPKPKPIVQRLSVVYPSGRSSSSSSTVRAYPKSTPSNTYTLKYKSGAQVRTQLSPAAVKIYKKAGVTVLSG